MISDLLRGGEINFTRGGRIEVASSPPIVASPREIQTSRFRKSAAAVAVIVANHAEPSVIESTTFVYSQQRRSNKALSVVEPEVCFSQYNQLHAKSQYVTT